MNRWVAVGLYVFVIVFVLTYLVLWWFGMHNMLWYTIEGYRCELRPIEQRPNRDFFVSGRSRAAVGKVVTYDNRPNERFVELSCEINRMYCERQGYDYEYFSAVPYEDELPVYWLKVRLVMEEVLAAGPSIDWVMWIDSDAVFNKHEHRVEEFPSWGQRHHLRYFLDGEPVAGLTLKAKRPWRGLQSAEIMAVFTAEGYRREGYARALLGEARSHFRVVRHSKDLTGAGAAWKRGVRSRIRAEVP